MQNSSSRPDPSTFPVLTEVVELPFEPAPPPAAVAPEAPSAAQTEETPEPLPTEPVSESPAPSLDDAALESVRLALLEDLKTRINPWLEQRIREHLTQALEGLVSGVTQNIHQELDQLLEEALNKTLIQREAQLAQEKLREKADADDPATT